MIKKGYFEVPAPRPQGGGVLQRPLVERFTERLEKQENGCWIWKGLVSNQGYGQVNYKHKLLAAHRVSYEMYINEIPDNLVICHKCDVRLCVNPDHLFLGTSKENEVDKYSKGRGVEGSKSPNAKLNESQVLAIRQERSDLGTSLNNLATKYGVSKKMILLIIQRKWWRHI